MRVSLRVSSLPLILLVFSMFAYSQNVIATIPVGTSPVGLAVNDNTNTIYVANHESNTVSVIDGGTNAVVATIPVGPGPGPILAYVPANLIYVNNTGDRTMTVIDGNSNAVLKTVPLPFAITGWTELGLSKFVYVADNLANQVRVVDITRLKVVTTITVTRPVFVTANAKGKLVYVSTLLSTILVIDGSTNTVINTFTLGAGTNFLMMSVDTVHNRLFVATYPAAGGPASVAILDATTGAERGTTPSLGAVYAVQALSTGTAVAAGGDTQGAYVHSAIFINERNAQVTGMLDVGDVPIAVGYHAASGMIYIANGVSNTVSVISD
jgi:YVTN family beta-propeller protein